METLGQFGHINILPNREVTGTFSVETKDNINKESQPCNSYNQYSYTDCLRNYVNRISKCNFDILSNTFNNCSSNALVKLNDTLNELKYSTKMDIIKKTGCKPKCNTQKYDFQITKDEDITNMRKEWISSFYLSTKTTTNLKSVETYSYDEQVNMKTQINVNFIFQLFCALQDLIGAIGGYLGLFLGWSALSLVTAAPLGVKLIQQFMYKKMDV